MLVISSLRVVVDSGDARIQDAHLFCSNFGQNVTGIHVQLKNVDKMCQPGTCHFSASDGKLSGSVCN